ncbi:aminopeptidase P family protein [Robbsia andropogonis]|uniref:aminopeptidase P family protein n=2 Tax=Robbsia andropogonis TaxID=28092 RepID=UPI0004B74997|nr:aminopeptidase P family protein [Robbsia andropogonis]
MMGNGQGAVDAGSVVVRRADEAVTATAQQSALERVTQIQGRIATLRAAMAAAGLAAYVVPSSDPHLSEYPPARWLGRAWLSGFTGSAGTLVVTPTHAAVWADSRYWVQAEAQLAGTGIVLAKLQGGQVAPHIAWLAEHVERGGQVGIDAHVVALGAAQAMTTQLADKGVTLRTDVDLLDTIWLGRPALPDTPIYAHASPYAPRARTDKLAVVREVMASYDAHWHLVSTLDDLGWLLNLRGADVSYNPVFLGHALIGRATGVDGRTITGVTLFVDPRKVPASLAAELEADGITLAPYDKAEATVRALPPGSRLLIDPKRATLGMAQAALDAGAVLVEAANPSTLAKACKIPEEAEHIRRTMARDGAALCVFFAWLEQALAARAAGDVSQPPIDELMIDARLRAAREQQPGYVCESFATIAGFNANGAMPHYRATPDAFSVIDGDGLLLIDSGGQYHGGTTDITRVVPIGTPSEAQKRDYTTVLKGMISLSRARFPHGIRGPMLDAIARAPMWAEGIDFGHGTGHGVGYFLNVHEGPQVISHYANADAATAMLPGMITSIEPGVYRAGQWGVRIENLVMNQPAPRTAEGDTFGQFLAFETLTLCPIDTRCIQSERLTPEERAWLDAYHVTVRERVAPLVEGDALAWLEKRTQPL